MSRTSIVTVDYSCLISSLYLSSFSYTFFLSSYSLFSLSLINLCPLSNCCIMSLIMTSLGKSLLLLGIGLLSARWLVSLPSFSTLLVTLLVAVGEGFFLGVASTNAESESLVNWLSRLRGLPSTPPYKPSLFLFLACSLSLIN